MSQMTDALAKLSGGVYKQARTREEINKELSFFPYQLSEEAYEFYQWDGAPIGERFPDDWNGDLHDTSTYDCQLDGTLGIQEDYIHFLSIEEVSGYYPDALYNLKNFPFVSSEYYFLVITASETNVATSPVFIRENIKEELFFPSLTNMMMAIVESLETVGSVSPLIKGNCDAKDYGTAFYQDIRDEDLYQDICDYEDEIVIKIAQKYGSSGGSII